MGSETVPIFTVSSQSFSSGSRRPKPRPSAIAAMIHAGKNRFTIDKRAIVGSVVIDIFGASPMLGIAHDSCLKSDASSMGPQTGGPKGIPALMVVPLGVINPSPGWVVPRWDGEGHRKLDRAVA